MKESLLRWPRSTIYVALCITIVQMVLSSDAGVHECQDDNGDIVKCSYGVNATFFYYYNKTATRAEAVEECERQGGTLALIKSKRVQMHLEKNMKLHESYATSICSKKRLWEGYGNMYIGLSDENKEGEWVWDDGTKLSETRYINWKSDKNVCADEPNGGWKCSKNNGDQDAVVMRSPCQQNDFGKWFDGNAQKARNFICELEGKDRRRDRKEQVKESKLSTGPDNLLDNLHNTTILLGTSTMSTPTTADQFSTQSRIQFGDDVIEEQNATTVMNEMTTSSNEGTSASNNTGTEEPAILPRFDDVHSLNCEGDRGEIICEVMHLLRCMSAQVLKEDRDDRCPSAFGSSINAVTLFEEVVAKHAAQKVLEKNHAHSFTASVEGIQMQVTPLVKTGRSAREEECQCLNSTFANGTVLNTVNVDGSHVHLNGTAVLISAVLNNVILSQSGVLEMCPASKLQEHLNDNMEDKATLLSKNSSVLSISVFSQIGENLRKVSVPTSMEFDMKEDESVIVIQEDGKRRITDVDYQCVFLNTTINRWTPDGCTTIPQPGGKVRCECTHTTAFAVMVAIRSVKIPAWLENLIIVMETIGIIFLFTTLIMLAWLRKSLKRDRAITQINLSLALLLAHLFSVIGSPSSTASRLCEAMTLFTHFFLMCSMMWMLNEGLVLYKKTCANALNFDISKLRMILLSIGWILPAVYTLICFGIGLGLEKYMDYTEGYREIVTKLLPQDRVSQKYDRCWLGVDYKMVLAAAVPIAISLIIDVFFLAKVSRVIWAMTTQSRNMMPSDALERAGNTHVKSTFKALILLFPVLGIPWVLAFMVNIHGAEVIFTGIHGILNGLQGVFIFIIYILVNREIRYYAKRKIAKRSLNKTSSAYQATSTSTMFSVFKRKSHPNSSAPPSPRPSSPYISREHSSPGNRSTQHRVSFGNIGTEDKQ